jgi:hypothetical protein
VALTFDACSGAFDSELLEFLIRNNIPATIFATKKWLDHAAVGVAMLKARLDLFDIEDHGVLARERPTPWRAFRPTGIEVPRANTTSNPSTTSAVVATGSPVFRSIPTPVQRCRNLLSKGACAM